MPVVVKSSYFLFVCLVSLFRRKLDLHKKTGHSSSPAEPPPQKSLRCPLCLYHTTSRDRLVDHVVLHRRKHIKHQNDTDTDTRNENSSDTA